MKLTNEQILAIAERIPPVRRALVDWPIIEFAHALLAAHPVADAAVVPDIREQAAAIAERHNYTGGGIDAARKIRAIAASVADAAVVPSDAPFAQLLSMHAQELEQNEYAYFELAYTRRTEWMAWICSNHRDDDPNRKVIARGQGSTPQEACAAALGLSAPATVAVDAKNRGEKR